MQNPCPALTWDIFCRVIDNLGDIGVCWRLSANLAERGQRVRLWIDEPGPLAWMAPHGAPGIEVLPWREPFDARGHAPGDVWVEAFGCELPDSFLAARRTEPVWINLEYLSAEPFVERNHRLPSPVMSGSGRGLTKWFFYPGFTDRTGGLLRETGLASRHQAFDRQAWLAHLGLPLRPGEPRVSLFCYEPPSLQALLAHASGDWLITPGRAAAAVAGLKAGPDARLYSLPHLTQHDFDHLLWACDLNFVRGEDSLVRALWAGQPFVWHIYPQHDNAHHAKLNAFLDWLDAPPSLRDMHRHWNAVDDTPPRWPGWKTVGEWGECVRAARSRLLAQTDLCSQLLGFVTEKR